VRIVPLTLRQAAAFVLQHHRHSNPPTATKFAIGLRDGDALVGVAVTARPSAPALDDGFTLEVTRTCTDGTRNANSQLYGAAWRAARAMGYLRGITYTEEGESGASLLACGWRVVAELAPRGDWRDCAGPELLAKKYPQPALFEDGHIVSGKARRRWQIDHVGRA
jgi:hypothetical protein